MIVPSEIEIKILAKRAIYGTLGNKGLMAEVVKEHLLIKHDQSYSSQNLRTKTSYAAQVRYTKRLFIKRFILYSKS